LEYVSERGFRSEASTRKSVQLGASYAGRVALDRQLVKIPHLRDDLNFPLMGRLWPGEDFAVITAAL
jgi:hypothetical protein